MMLIDFVFGFRAATSPVFSQPSSVIAYFVFASSW
jgi:hypothetical protein